MLISVLTDGERIGRERGREVERGRGGRGGGREGGRKGWRMAYHRGILTSDSLLSHSELRSAFCH